MQDMLYLGGQKVSQSRMMCGEVRVHPLKLPLFIPEQSKNHRYKSMDGRVPVHTPLGTPSKSMQ